MSSNSPIFLNFHGFMGAPDNKNGRALALLFPEAQVLSPPIDYLKESPTGILERTSIVVKEHLATERPLILVGQSLGGFVAEALSRAYALPCLLTNPCLEPHLCGVIVNSPIKREFLEEYRTLCQNKKTENPNAYTLCTKTDEVLGEENFAKCMALGGRLLEVTGRHSSIENLQENLYRGVLEILSKK